jgi:hypothetical protein
VAPIDPVLALSKAVAVNNFIKSVLTNNNYGNTAGLASINAIVANPNYQQPVIGGVWFFEGYGEPIGYNYYPNQADNRNDVLWWLETLNLSLGSLAYQGTIPYFVLIAKT